MKFLYKNDPCCENNEYKINQQKPYWNGEVSAHCHDRISHLLLLCFFFLFFLPLLFSPLFCFSFFLFTFSTSFYFYFSLDFFPLSYLVCLNSPASLSPSPFFSSSFTFILLGLPPLSCIKQDTEQRFSSVTKKKKKKMTSISHGAYA